MPNPVPIPAATPRLQLRGITKRYPGCLANDGIDLSIQPGKSTPCSVKTAPAKAP